MYLPAVPESLNRPRIRCDCNIRRYHTREHRARHRTSEYDETSLSNFRFSETVMKSNSQSVSDICIMIREASRGLTLFLIRFEPTSAVRRRQQERGPSCVWTEAEQLLFVSSERRTDKICVLVSNAGRIFAVESSPLCFTAPAKTVHCSSNPAFAVEMKAGECLCILTHRAHPPRADAP